MATSPDNSILTAALRGAVTHSGASLAELAAVSPLLVVFLRHGGCPFCRETLALLSRQRGEIEAAGVQVVLVHVMPDEQAGTLFGHYRLEDLPRLSDPQLKLHQAFALRKGSARDVMGPRVWWPGFKSVILRGHRPGRPSGDIYQLGGAFLVENGEITAAHRSQKSSEQPDFAALVKQLS